MAEGYAKVKGRPGAAIGTSGPGGMNFVTPIGNFFYDSVPGIFITGQINSKFIKNDPQIRQVGFQEADIVSIVAPITKYAKLVTKPESIRYELERALVLAEERRPGPVLLDIPMDVQKADIDPEKLMGFDRNTAGQEYDLGDVEQKINSFIEDIKQKKRPVILAGGGLHNSKRAKEDILETGRILKIPIFPTWNALDIITSDYEFYGGRVGTYGGRGRNFGLQNSDLLLAVGSRISGRITGGNLKSFAREAKKYAVDVDKTLLQKELQQVPFNENIYCDAGIFLKRLNARLKEECLPDFSSWTSRVMEWKEKYDPVLPEYNQKKEFVNPYMFIRTLSEEMGKNDVFLADCGGNVVVSNHAFETKKGQRYISSNGNSPMGFSFAGAIGAWFAAPERQVVCVIGDGGFNMNIQELQVLKQHGVKVKTFIMNNHVHGIIKAYQETNFEGRFVASDQEGGYEPPDFIKVVKAYEVEAVRLENQDKTRKIIQEVLAFDGPIVCDVNCHEWWKYEPRIFGFNTPIEDMYPYLPREEFRKNMIIEPWENWEHPEEPGSKHQKSKEKNCIK